MEGRSISINYLQLVLTYSVLLCCLHQIHAQEESEGLNITLSNRTEYVALLGERVSLVCGTDLESSPPADIIWSRNSGPTVDRLVLKSDDSMQNSMMGYTLRNGPDVVKLIISNASASDNGSWTCRVNVMGLRLCNPCTEELLIQLIVISPSGQPQNVSVESASYSWMSIQWQAPYNIGSHGISYYNVTVYNVSLLNDMVMLISETSTENNETRANITGLQPGMSIQIQVAGITRVGNLIAQGPYSNSFQYNTSIAALVPVCNSEPRLLTSRMYATNVTFGVVWSYQQLETELLLLSGVVLSYTISIRNLGRVSTTTGSKHLQINQTSKELSFVSTNAHSGTFVVNVTMNSPQGSHTTTCPTLYLNETVIQLVLSRVLDCSEWVLQYSIEKRQAILDLLYRSIQNICDGCEYTTTNQAMECADENNDIVKLRARLFSPSNMTERVLNSVKSWITNTRSIEVQGIRFHLESNCSLVIESLESPFYCRYKTTSSGQPVTHTSTIGGPHERPNTVAEAMAIIAFVGCGILVVIVLMLMLYIAYKRYRSNYQKALRLSSNVGIQQNELQIPMVNINRLSTTSRMSIPETIPECEFEECEKDDHEDFELSTSLAYGAVDTVTASRLRLGSDLGSIAEDIERTYNNPIYEGNPIYETIKLEPSKQIDPRPNSSVENENSDCS